VEQAIPSATDMSIPTAKAATTIMGTTIHSPFCLVLEKLLKNQVIMISRDASTNREEKAGFGM
jgi:hypothetical protein